MDSARFDSFVDYAYAEIRTRIQIGTYPPGSKLSAQEISKSLNVSRTPVVSALNRLVAEGLAVNSPRRGVFVSRLSHKKIRDLIEARVMIEVYSVRPAIENMDFYPEVIDRMEALLPSFDSLGDYDYERGSDLESQFHSSLIYMSGNEELKRLYRASWGIGATYYMYSKCGIKLSQRTISLQEHTGLLQLLKARDVDALEIALRKHLLDALRVLSWIIDTNPSSFN